MRDRARPLHRSLLGLGVVVLVVGLLGGTALADPPAPPASQGAPTPPGGGPRAGEGFHEHRDGTGEVDVNICSYATAPGEAHCNARIRTDDAAQQLGGALRAQGASPQVLPSAAAFLPA